MSAMLAVAKLLAHDAGTAQPITRERAFPLSSDPLVLIPIVMAGESPALFGLGVGDGRGRAQIFVCPNPINRDEQYAMLAAAWNAASRIVERWRAPNGPSPQIIVTGGDSARLVLGVIDRTAYSQRTDLSNMGRLLFWFDKRSDCPDSACLLSLPKALSACLATGQDEIADQHLGAFLEWCVPADGKIWERVRLAELFSASGATAPEFDRDQLDQPVDMFIRAVRAGDTRRAARVRKEIEKLIGGEIDRRYELVRTSLQLLSRFPESEAAAEVAVEDEASFRQHAAYVANPNNRLARGLDRNMQTSEFMSREFAVGRMTGLGVRHVSSVRANALHAGDLLEGEVTDLSSSKVGRRTVVHQTITTTQEQLSLRSGDKLCLMADEKFVYRVVTITSVPASGGSAVTLEVVQGKTLTTLPKVADRVVLTPPLHDRFGLMRARQIAWDRMRAKPTPVAPPQVVRPSRDWAALVETLRGKK
jgi:hypothetical protein